MRQSACPFVLALLCNGGYACTKITVKSWKNHSILWSQMYIVAASIKTSRLSLIIYLSSLSLNGQWSAFLVIGQQFCEHQSNMCRLMKSCPI